MFVPSAIALVASLEMQEQYDDASSNAKGWNSDGIASFFIRTVCHGLDMGFVSTIYCLFNAIEEKSGTIWKINGQHSKFFNLVRYRVI